MRTSSRNVRFRHSFSLGGLATAQPAGSYVVLTHAQGTTMKEPGHRGRVTTLIEIPTTRGGVPVTVAAIIDAGDLESALILDGMRRARLQCVHSTS